MRNHSEQAENSFFFQQLDLCCHRIAQLIGEKQISEWTNSDYIHLSRLLSKKTKIRLSESTLKRIFGKSKTPDRYHPQKATRDALAQFIGYQDWNHFEARNTEQVEQPILHIKASEDVSNSQRKNSASWIVLSSFLAIAFILTVIVLRPAKEAADIIQDARLICINPNGDTPHSAIFKLERRTNSKDSLKDYSIEFRDGRSKRKRFTSQMLNHYYEMPGRFYPVLLYKSEIIDTAYVYLQTNGWSATASNLYDTTRVYPVSISKKINNRSPIRVNIQDVLRSGVDTLSTFFVAFSDIKPTNISADNFELTVYLKTSENRAGVRCSQVDISVYGEKDQHSFGIIKPACTIWTSYHFSENIKDGSEYDLRDFGYDLSNGGMLTLRIENKKISLSINGKRIYTTNYKKSVGNVMGAKISFAGIGEFKDFKLIDLKTGTPF